MSYINVKESKINKLEYIAKTKLNASIEDEIRNSEITIIPMTNYREVKQMAFHHGTTDFLRFLQQELPTSKIGICVNDEDYVELSLNSIKTRISTIIVDNLTSFKSLVIKIAKYIISLGYKNVESTIIVPTNKGSAFELGYNGPAGLYEKHHAEAINDLIKKAGTLLEDFNNED